MLLAINWAEFGIKAAQLLLSLSILIVFHEFGHYITARWFKCRVEKFYLFFDPWFSLFKKKVGETEYGIGWLPLGGYVKISGMIDESMDKEAMKLPAQPWEFRSKPAWQRLIIMIGGVTVNVILAFIIYAMILFVWGENPVPMNSVKNGVWVTDSLMYEAGLRNGDKIVSIGGSSVEYFDDVNKKILTAKEMVVDRNGVEKKITFPTDLVGKLVESKRRRRLIEMRVTALVGEFDKKDTSFASRSGLKDGDRIVAVDSTPVVYFDEMIPLVAKKKNGTVQFTVDRKGETVMITSKVGAEGKTGLGLADFEDYAAAGDFKIDHKTYSFLESFPAGVKKTFSKLGDYIEQFKLILRPETGAYKGVGGFKSMGSIFPPVWDWESFWSITALFSIILAFMNLLPIPALDGGHVLFTLIEMITGRKPNEKFLEYAQIVGMVILFGLLIYANGNDLFGWNR
ncbi:MAG: RIP metalloprotease RseP [Chitinophagaceae bacterium]|nr:RIP metalloprotease RseP [Chitinophagaceae bacterium]